MYDKEQLLEELTVDDIKVLLVELGAQHIKEEPEKQQLITNTICHNLSDGKMKLYYYYESKDFHCYTHCSKNYSVFDLVIANHKLRGIELSFPESINWILKTLGKEQNDYKPEGFHTTKKGVREEILWVNSFKKKKLVNLDLKTYTDKIFMLFSKKPHPLFLADNISKESMKKFEVMYYDKANRIIIPHRHYKTGKLIGLKSRCLNFDEIDKGYKYIPLTVQNITYSYPTYQNLFGLYQNKEFIKKIKRVVIFESEKSVMQFESYFPNQNFSVALCGSNISKQQVNMLLELGVEEVILALDKEYTILNTPEADKYYEKLLRLGSMFSRFCKVSMIWDTEKLIGLKDSPSDRGKEVFIKLFKNRKVISTKE